MENRLTALLGIQYPIIQAGMIWASGQKLASAVSNAGGLGILGAGSMYPDVLREHIAKVKFKTDKPFGVNIPMLYPDLEEIVQIVIDERVPVVITSAGNPKVHTQRFKDAGITVMHVVSSVKFALKAQAAGVDAVIAEGFEAGGHNGRDETTTLALIPMVARVLDVPLVAAGGIATGNSMLATMALGADGVQIGSRFLATPEASSHQKFKDMIVASQEGDTVLTLKELAPVRLLKNKFFDDVTALYATSPTKEDLTKLLGRARAKKGMFEGDLEEGELEVGQVAGLIDSIIPAADVVKEIVTEFNKAAQRIGQWRL